MKSNRHLTYKGKWLEREREREREREKQRQGETQTKTYTFDSRQPKLY